jgi:hypothetical protein
MLSSPQVLSSPNILIECTSFEMLCTSVSKHHGHDMLGLRLSC